MLRISRSKLFLVLCVSLFLAYSCGYLYVFGAALDEGSWEHLFGYTRIIAPDTFLYLSIAKSESAAEFIRSTGVKNSLGPSLVWMIFRGNWYFLTIFNAVCLSLTLIYTRKLLVLLDPSQKARCHSVSLILTFVCMYYGIGSLKEIPTLLGFTAFVCHFLMGQKTKTLMWLLFLILFRFQFGFLIVPVYLLSKFRRNPLRLTVVGALIVGVMFPLLSTLDVFTPDAVGRFRSGSGQAEGSVGSQVEFVRGNVFGLSLLAIVIRVVQSIFEPVILLVRTSSIYEDGSLSIYHGHALLVLLVMLRSWVLALFRILSGGDGRNEKFGILYSFLAIAVFAAGGTGLVSHRFLVPVYGLLLVAAHANPVKASRRRPKPWLATPLRVASAS